MISLIRKFSISFSFCLVQLATDSYGQTYTVIGYGSRYVCGHLSDGASQLFKANGSRSVGISVSRAVATINTDILKLNLQINRLNKIRFSLKDRRLSGSEIRTYNLIAAGSSLRSSLPTIHSRRLKAIQLVLKDIKSKVKNKKREIAAVIDCSRGSALSNPVAEALSYEQVKIKGLDGFYVATVMYLPKQSSSFWYCIKGPWQTEGEPRLFSSNPCVDGWPSVRNNNCSQVTPSRMHTSIYASRFFLGNSWDANNPYVEAAVTELEKFYAGNILGRPRTSVKDDCKIIR